MVVDGWGTFAVFYTALGVAITSDGVAYVGDETKIRRVEFSGTSTVLLALAEVFNLIIIFTLVVVFWYFFPWTPSP